MHEISNPAALWVIFHVTAIASSQCRHKQLGALSHNTDVIFQTNEADTKKDSCVSVLTYRAKFPSMACRQIQAPGRGDRGGSISLNSKRLLLSSPIVYPAPGLLTQ